MRGDGESKANYLLSIGTCILFVPDGKMAEKDDEGDEPLEDDSELFGKS